MLTWIENESVGVGQDPNSTEDPSLAASHTQKWGAPEIIVAPQYNGSFWYWTLASATEWVPKVGAASSLRDAQALTVWNKAKATVLYGDYVRNPPYVFQSASGATKSPAPTPVPAPKPEPAATKPPAKSHDVLKTNLIVGSVIAAIVAVAWYVT